MRLRDLLGRLIIPKASVRRMGGDIQFAGLVDDVSAASIAGWCVDLSRLGETAELELVVSGAVCARVRPFLVRQDVLKKHDREVRSGFRIHIGKSLAESLLAAGNRNPQDARDPFLSFEVRVTGHDVVLPAAPGTDLKLARDDLGRVAKGEYFNAQDPFYVRFERLKAAAASGLRADAEQQDVKLIAFYLPQYHPFPENNEWWGEGFTDWTNVARVQPQFPEHYQPHLPADLGFYDLRLSEVRARQADLAREYGLHGFCYHYYWFGGRTVMENPIRSMLESGTPDFPFCLCWANESWSRRWDGSENEVLLAQPHAIDTDERFIVDVMPFLKDRRYITVNGAPLIVIYRVSLLPDPVELFRRWRLLAAAQGVPDLHIVMAETFGLKDPYKSGCDAAVGFPPHGLSIGELTQVRARADDRFKGKIFDYDDVVRSEIATRSAPDYVLYPGIMPSWDNTPRRGPDAHVFHNASPDSYEVWLRHLADAAKKNLPAGQRFIFINAWNEWGEGTHLEPDRRFGRRYLEATQRAISSQADADSVLLELELAHGAGNASITRATKVLRREFKALRQANEYMAGQFAQTYYHLNTKRSEWKKRIDFDPGLIEWRTRELRFHVDRVNQFPFPYIPQEMTLDRQSVLEVAGWLFPSNWKGGEIQQYLLAENGNGERVFALVRNRFERPDVSKAYPGQVHIPSGFEVAVPMDDLKPGTYDLSVLLTDGTSWKGARSPFRIEII